MCLQRCALSDWSRITSYLAIITPCEVIIILKQLFSKWLLCELLLFIFKETRNTTLSNYTKEKVYIIILRLSGHFWIIPFTLSWRLLNNIHFTLCKYITVKYSKRLRKKNTAWGDSQALHYSSSCVQKERKNG